MTDETKKLFDAPWAVDEKPSETFGEVFDVMDEDLYLHYARCYDEKTANRLARLPELYDALFDSVLRICSTCIGSNLSDTPLDDIGRYCRANCPVHKYTALLKKVRNGK